MGLLNLFSRTPPPTLTRLWPGCFTVDRNGEIITSTLPQSVSPEIVRQIARCVLPALQEAKRAHLQLNEIQVHYPALKITARALRDGAIVFVAPLNAPGGSP